MSRKKLLNYLCVNDRSKPNRKICAVLPDVKECSAVDCPYFDDVRAYMTRQDLDRREVIMRVFGDTDPVEYYGEAIDETYDEDGNIIPITPPPPKERKKPGKAKTDIKDFLRRLRREQTELELLQLKADNIPILRALNFAADKIQSSTSNDLTALIIKNGEILNTLSKKAAKLERDHLKAYKMILNLENRTYRQVLIMYYLSRKQTDVKELTRPYSLEEVAKNLNYTYSYVKHIHGEALDKLREMEQ